MLAAENFETRWSAAEPAPRGSGTVRLICVRVEEGVHETPGRAEVTVEDGLTVIQVTRPGMSMNGRTWSAFPRSCSSNWSPP